MTIIAYRNGILAADTSTTVDGCVLPGRIKIVRRDDGALIAACGACGYGDAFRAWASAGEVGEPPKVADASAGVIFMRGGLVRVFDCDEGAYTIAPPYFALGSGMAFALGALYAGATAEQAAKAAIEHDSKSNGSVMTVAHDA